MRSSAIHTINKNKFFNQTLAASVVAATITFALPAAALAVTQAGLKLAPVKEAPAAISPVAAVGSSQPIQPVAPVGCVVSQNPQPGQRVDASTPIELTVEQ